MEQSDIQSDLESVQTFLNTLGIVHSGDIRSETYWAGVHREIGETTGKQVSETGLADPMSEEVVDYFFSTPSVAAKFLAADLPRLTQVLVSLNTLPGLPKNPGSVAEIGGGPGIVSLWLALKNPDTRFVVYDRSQNALAVGKLWARTLGIANVRYEKASYETLAHGKPETSFDLVLALGALNLYFDEPHLSAGIDPLSISSPLNDTLHRFAEACRNLLSPSGTLYFSQGSFNDLGLLCLFYAFRKCAFGMDWSNTLCVGEGEAAGFSVKSVHLFMNPERPTVFTDAREDLAVFLFSGKMPRFTDKIILGHGDFEAWLGLLSAGTKLADIRAVQADGRMERFSIYVKSGMLGFFSSHSNGGRSGFVYHAASFESAVFRLKTIVQTYRQRAVTLTETFWHPYFAGNDSGLSTVQ